MRQKSGFTAVLLLITLVLTQEFGPFLSAQTAPPTPDQLDQLLAPVALYPDSLLAQITTASTNPQEILDVDNWLQQNSGLKGTALTDAAQQQGFDPAFIALVNFPQVLDMMAQHVDDYAAIGEAFTADQSAVSASVQRLRAQAYASGALRSNSEQRVEVQQPAGHTVYVIQPAAPQVVYVPRYDPTVVYAAPSSGAIVAASLITFGVGIGIGALLVDNRPWGWGGWGWNWGSRRVYYNHGYWGGWSNPYRPARVWYRPRPIIWANRPGYRGDWRYRPQGYRPPYYGRPTRPGYTRQPWGPNNRPGYNRPGYNRPGYNNPGYNRPGYNRPGTPTGSRPPSPSRPSVPNRPGTQPPRPGTPDRPGYNRPTAPGQTRPNGSGRPTAERPARPNSENRSRPEGRSASPPRPAPRPQSPQGDPRH